MRPLVRLILLAAIGIMPIVYAGGLAAAQEGTPAPRSEALADCVPGRDPSVEEEAQLIEITGKNYLEWEGVCEPTPVDEGVLGELIPGQLSEQLVNLVGTGLPPELQEDLELALVEAEQAGITLEFQPFDVGFREQWAAVPRIIPDPETGQPLTELMLVFVVQGSFVLDLQDERAIYVYTMRPEGQFDTTEPWNPDAPEPHYTLTGTPLADDVGNPCANACRVRLDEPVQLLPGDFAIAQRGAICRYCLEQTASQIEEEGVPVLEVYALMDTLAVPDGFSWVQSWRAIQEAVQARQSSPTMLGWALPALGTGCRDN